MRETVFADLPDCYVHYIRRNRNFSLPYQHYHTGYEIFFLVEGSRNVFINDKAWNINGGCVELIRPFEFHYSCPGDYPEYERYVLNFSKNYIADVLSEEEHQMALSVFQKHLLILSEEEKKELVTLYSKIKEEIEKNTPVSIKLSKFHIVELLYFLGGINVTPEDHHTTRGQALISDAIKYINSNYTHEITVHDVAQVVHLSQYHFCRLFKNVTGTTFLQYLNNKRLKEAHILLSSADIPLSQIALETGFSSGEHFTRVFKKAYGMTPREFKKTLKSA